MTEHSTPPRFDPTDGARIIRRTRHTAEGTLHTVAMIAADAPPALREMVEDRMVAWEDRIAAEHAKRSDETRRRREAAVLRRLNRPHRRLARWLHSWRG